MLNLLLHFYSLHYIAFVKQVKNICSYTGYNDLCSVVIIDLETVIHRNTFFTKKTYFGLLLQSQDR